MLSPASTASRTRSRRSAEYALAITTSALPYGNGGPKFPAKCSSSDELAGFQDALAAPLPADAVLGVLGPDGSVLAETSAKNILVELPVFVTLSGGATPTLVLPGGTPAQFANATALAAYLLELSIAAEPINLAALSAIYQQATTWLDQVDQPVLAAAAHYSELAQYDATHTNADRVKLDQTAVQLALQVAAQPEDSRQSVSATIQLSGHQTEVTVGTDGRATFHDIDDGALSVLEGVVTAAVDIATYFQPELAPLAVALNAAQAGQAFANGNILGGVVDLAATVGFGLQLDGEAVVGQAVSTAAQAVGGVYGVVQGAVNGDGVGALAAGLEAAAAVAGGIAQVDPSTAQTATAVAKGLGAAAAVTSFANELANGNVANALLVDLAPFFPEVASAYQNTSAAIAASGLQEADGSAIQIAAKTPNTGDPNTWFVNPGSGQMRFYGPDGNPAVDIDVDHDHGLGIPHFHVWVPGIGRDTGNPMPLNW